jgi:hypothetical protein
LPAPPVRQSPVLQLVPSGWQPVRAKTPPLHHTADGIAVAVGVALGWKLTCAWLRQNVAESPEAGNSQFQGLVGVKPANPVGVGNVK